MSVVRGVGNLSRPPVMADVARLAGVSHQTVSRVLNEHPNVRPLTRDRVLAAIRELAYRPNAAARTLVTRRTHTLGVITADTMLYGPTSMLYGFERAAHDTFFVSVASLPALDRRSMLDAVDRFLGQGVEGIIVIATQDTAVAALGHVPRRCRWWRWAAAPARRSPRWPSTTRPARPRRPGTCSAWGTRSSTTSPDRLLPGREGTRRRLAAGDARGRPARARRAGRRLVRLLRLRAGRPAGRGTRATAVFCGNDTMALGVIRALTERGLRVPEDVSVVGFDDVPEAGFFRPPLTTVRQDFDEVGRQR